MVGTNACVAHGTPHVLATGQGTVDEMAAIGMPTTADDTTIAATEKPRPQVRQWPCFWCGTHKSYTCKYCKLDFTTNLKVPKTIGDNLPFSTSKISKVRYPSSNTSSTEEGRTIRTLQDRTTRNKEDEANPRTDHISSDIDEANEM